MSRLTGWDKGNAYMLKCFEGDGGCEDMDTTKCNVCENNYAVFEKLARLEDAEEQGQFRWVPKIGDEVYTIISADCDNCPYPDDEAFLHCSDCPPKVLKDIFTADYIEDWYNGRVLQTKEEAEVAVKGVTER